MTASNSREGSTVASPVAEVVAREADAVEYLRSGVLGLDLRGKQRNGATVLVIRDLRTGEEIDGALEASERQRRILEDRLRAEKARASTAEARASTAEKRVRELEQRLRDLTGQTRPTGRDS